MKIKEFYDIYRDKKGPINYFKFINLLQQHITLEGKFSDIELSDEIINDLRDKLNMNTIEVIPEISDDRVYLDENDYVDDKHNEPTSWITARYDELLANVIELKDISKLTYRLNGLTYEKALNMVDRLMKSPKRIKKIMIPQEYRNSPNFMTVLLRDYNYAFVPHVWRRGSKNYNIYACNIVKIFRWEHHHVVVFNETDILHIY